MKCLRWASLAALATFIVLYTFPLAVMVIDPFCRTLADGWVAKAISTGFELLIFAILLGGLWIYDLACSRRYIQADPEWTTFVEEIQSSRGLQLAAIITFACFAIVAVWPVMTTRKLDALPGLILPTGFLILGFLPYLIPARILSGLEELPGARFDLESARELKEEDGRKVEYRWRRLGHLNDEISAEFILLESEYQAAAAVERLDRRAETYARYITEQFGDSVRAICVWFRKMSLDRGFTAVEELENVIGFARSIPYEKDEVTHPEHPIPDYADFPIELLWEERGDCEDHALLAASLLYWLGHPVALFFLGLDECGHVALGYATPQLPGTFFKTSKAGIVYSYIETVPSNTPTGEIPDEFLSQLKDAEVVEII